MTAWLFKLLLGAAVAAEPGYGILLLAHGGEPQWNAEVAKIGAALSKQAPTEVALGMADPAEMQKAVSRLEEKKVGKIVAVPLFINSSSEVMDQTRFVLGIDENPSITLKDGMERMMRDPAMLLHMHGHNMVFDKRVETGLPIVVTGALDDAPEVSEILLARAKALSKDPGKETVVLVGHGPVSDVSDIAWRAVMRRLAGAVKSRGGFKDAKARTLRDDSPAEVKRQAAADLRELVAKAGAGGGRAIVLPYLIARGGIEDHIGEALKGLDYAWDGEPLCPHPAIARWAARVAAKGAKLDNMRRFK